MMIKRKVNRMSDLISRQKTIKTIYYYFEDLIKTLPKIVNSDGKKIVDISKTDEYLKIDKAIRELITILPSEKPRGGEWIFLDECSNSGYYCSRCRNIAVGIDGHIFTTRLAVNIKAVDFVKRDY